MKQIPGKHEKDIKFYQTAWFTSFMLIAFCPVGVYLLWKNKFMSKPGRIAVTVIFAPVIIFGIFFWGAIISSPGVESLPKVSDRQVNERNIESIDKTNNKTNKKSSTNDVTQLQKETQLLELVESDTKYVIQLYNHCCEFASDADGFDLQTINQYREIIAEKEIAITDNSKKIQDISDTSRVDLYYDMLASSSNISQYVVGLTDMMVKDYKQGLNDEESRFVDDIKNKLDREVTTYNGTVTEVIKNLEKTEKKI